MSNFNMPTTMREARAQITQMRTQLAEAREIANKLEEAAKVCDKAAIQRDNRIYVLEQDINRKDDCIRYQQEEIDSLEERLRQLRQERDDQAATIRGLERRCAQSSTVQAVPKLYVEFYTESGKLCGTRSAKVKDACYEDDGTLHIRLNEWPDDQRVSELELEIDAYRTALRSIASGHPKPARYAQLMLKIGD